MRNLFLITLIFLGLGIEAQTIEVIVVQDETVTSDRSLLLSELLSMGCLDALFDGGYIGTNRRPSIGTTATYNAIAPDIETIEGFIEYQLRIFVVYTAAEVLDPPDAIYRLVRIADLAILKEGLLAAILPGSSNYVLIENACKQMGKTIANAGIGAIVE